jgi:hypothetical protein
MNLSRLPGMYDYQSSGDYKNLALIPNFSFQNNHLTGDFKKNLLG